MEIDHLDFAQGPATVWIQELPTEMEVVAIAFYISLNAH